MDLLQRIKSGNARIGIIGLGYVGLPLAVEFAKAGFHVTGFDVDPSKVETLNSGESYIPDVLSEELAAVVHAAPLPVSPGTLAAVTEHIGFLVPRLRLVRDQLVQCRRRLDTVLEALATAEADRHEHRDVTVLRSLPGVGRVVAATMLAEASHLLADRDYQTLRAHAGVAPVTRQSGKGRYVMIRRSCNHRLRNAVFHWARNSVRLDERCRAQYMRLRQHHGYARALRGVADRLLGLLMAMLSSGTVYDRARRHSVHA